MGKRAKDLAEEWLPSNALYNQGGSKAPRHLEDLGQLRQRFPDIPQSVLDELSELIRRSLGVDF
jgi:hypothetical protein